VAGGVILFLLIVGAFITPTTTEESSTSPGEITGQDQPPEEEAAPVDEPTEEPAAQPNPEGSIEGSCDYVLGDFTETESGYRFVADATLINEGNVGIEVKAIAVWFLSGGDKVKATKSLRVPYGKSKRTGFSVIATQDQIDLHQSLGFDTETCKLNAQITDTFGKAG
jgi:hypothetical protein